MAERHGDGQTQKVAVTTTTVADESLEQLKHAGFRVVVNRLGRRPTEAECLDLLQGAVGVLAGTGPLTARVLSQLPELRVISRCGVGLDNVDLEAARSRGVLVCTTNDSATHAVAELTVGVLLAVLRRIAEADRAMRAGSWQPLMGSLLAPRTVGIVGLGRIGSRVAQLSRAFGARVVATDLKSRSETMRELDVEPLDLDELLAVADVVSLHLPYSQATHHLIDRRRIGAMKQGAILVNAARGGIVDEQALAEALRSGHLAGAGLDTFAEEPYNGPLLQTPGTVVTCHMGSYASEARAAMETEAIDNLLAGLQLACRSATRVQRTSRRP